MTTTELRKLIHVIVFFNHSEGAYFEYTYGDKRKTLTAGIDSLYAELILIGSIETREEFEDYKICQWDALTMIIRHEMANEIEKESGMIDINNAIDKLKKNG